MCDQTQTFFSFFLFHHQSGTSQRNHNFHRIDLNNLLDKNSCFDRHGALRGRWHRVGGLDRVGNRPELEPTTYVFYYKPTLEFKTRSFDFETCGKSYRLWVGVLFIWSTAKNGSFDVGVVLKRITRCIIRKWRKAKIVSAGGDNSALDLPGRI